MRALAMKTSMAHAKKYCDMSVKVMRHPQPRAIASPVWNHRRGSSSGVRASAASGSGNGSSSSSIAAGAVDDATTAQAPAPPQLPSRDYEHAVDPEAFRTMGYQVVDWIADFYARRLETLPVKPNVQVWRGGGGRAIVCVAARRERSVRLRVCYA